MREDRTHPDWPPPPPEATVRRVFSEEEGSSLARGWKETRGVYRR